MDSNTLFNEQNLVILALVLIILLLILTYSAYFTYNVDTQGNELDCWGTVQNMFGFLPIDSSKRLIKNIRNKTTDIVYNGFDTIKDEIDVLTNNKEVFNIDSNIFTYDQAASVCKAYGGELATYDQVLKAYNNGANWCNYGWSANQMALYPIQQGFYDKVQDGPVGKRTSCGKTGVNGGFFSDPSLKFGVNCYGIRPRADPTKIVYQQPHIPTQPITPIILDDTIIEPKPQIDISNLDIRPFNNDKWSKYSHKNSTYIIGPNTSNVIDNSSDLDKDPRKLDI